MVDETDHRAPAAKPERERGAITLEFVGTVAVVLVMMLTAWQGLLAMHALSQTNTAARDAARAASLGEDWNEAGRAALSESLQEDSHVECVRDAADVTCTAHVNVPLINIGGTGSAIPPMTMTREATMPDLEQP